MSNQLQQQANEVLDKILQQNGPEMDDYEMITDIIDQLEDVDSFRDKLYRHISPGTLFYHTYTKPRGYAGDYEIIAKMYSEHISPKSAEVKWDLFFHWVPATQAVRNRKHILEQTIRKSSSTIKKVLILGSGPSEDVNHFIKNHPKENIHFDLLDLDQDALYYSAVINQKFIDRISFIKANALKYSPTSKYDLIYASGLFDYFNDKVFAYMIKKYFPFLSENGRIVIGNFADDNPSRHTMEKMTDWYLYHRSPEKLRDLAKEVQQDLSKIDVCCDETGINLFLEIQKS